MKIHPSYIGGKQLGCSRDFPREPAKKIPRLSATNFEIKSNSNFAEAILPPELISLIVLCLHDSPHCISNISLVSKPLRALVKITMEEVCRRRWLAKFDFSHRWSSALKDSLRVTPYDNFWYLRYFEEERKASGSISSEDLVRLSWKLEVKGEAGEDSAPTPTITLRFSHGEPNFNGRTLHFSYISRGRVNLSSLSFLLDGPAKNYAKIQDNTINWFLQTEKPSGGDLFLFLGMPQGLNRPCLAFRVRRLNSWQIELESDLYKITPA